MIHARKDYNRIQDPAQKIPEDEPVFLLRAQDRTAAEVLRFWIALNKMLYDHDPKAVQLAEKHLERFEAWPVKKSADV